MQSSLRGTDWNLPRSTTSFLKNFESLKKKASTLPKNIRKAWRASQELSTHYPSQATEYNIVNLFQRLSPKNRNHNLFEPSYLRRAFSWVQLSKHSQAPKT